MSKQFVLLRRISIVHKPEWKAVGLSECTNPEVVCTKTWKNEYLGNKNISFPLET